MKKIFLTLILSLILSVNVNAKDKYEEALNEWFLLNNHTQYIEDNKDIEIALNASGADVSYSEIITDKGHDSFLLDEQEFLKTLKGFIDSTYEKFKNEKRV